MRLSPPFWSRLLPICLLSAFLFPRAEAQPLVPEWTFTFDSPGDGDGVASGIAVDGADQVHAVGSAGPMGRSDLILVGLPSSGPPPTWLNVVNLEQYDAPAVRRPLALGDAGEAYLAASLRLQDQTGVFFVSQITAAGTLGWQYRKTSGQAFAWAVAADAASDRVYAAGYLSEVDPAFSDGWLVQLGANDGAVHWEYRSGSRFRDLRLDAAANAFVTGEGPIGNFLVAKINPLGQEEWRYASGIVGSGERLVLDGAGNVYAVGTAWGPSGFDILVVKLSPAGEEIWTFLYGDANRREFGVDIALDDEGNAYVCGYLSQESGNIGIAIRVASGTGAQEWVRLFAGGLSRILVAEGHLVTLSSTYDIGFNLYALDPGSGALHWTYAESGVICRDLQWTADAAYICGMTSGHDFLVEKLSNRVTPVDRIDLSPAAAGAEGVVLSWAVLHSSSLAAFHVERAPSLGGPFDRITDRPIPRGGAHHFTYIDRGAVAGRECFYRVCGLRTDGTAGPVSSTAGVLVPAAFPTLTISPNPAPAGVPVSFTLPVGQGAYGLDIFDSTGRHVRSLAAPAPGTARVLWDGRAEGGSPVASGVYLARFPLAPTAKFLVVR